MAVVEAFLICALSVPGVNFTRPAIKSYHLAKNEIEDLKKFIRKNDPDAEVFITPKGQADKLREHGWSRVPFTWGGKEVWIQRKPKSDARRAIGVSA